MHVSVVTEHRVVTYLMLYLILGVLLHYCMIMMIDCKIFNATVECRRYFKVKYIICDLQYCRFSIVRSIVELSTCQDISFINSEFEILFLDRERRVSHRHVVETQQLHQYENGFISAYLPGPRESANTFYLHMA